MPHSPERSTPPPSRVAVLDAGGQYVDMIKKVSERLGYPADILPFATPAHEIEGAYGAIILSGSPASAQDESAPRSDPSIWQSKVPKLGICHGLHEAVHLHGGKVERGASRQDGRVKTNVDTNTLLFQGIKKQQTALFTHGNFVTVVPEGFDVIGWHELEDGTEVVSAVEGPNNFTGVQFHPEVLDDTPEGYTIFENFFKGIAKLKPDSNFHEGIIEQRIVAKRAEIRQVVGNRPVIAFISGGVDSAAALALAATEIDPRNLHAFYIKSFLMRDEDDMVIQMLEASGLHVKVIEASDYFLSATIERGGITYGPLVDEVDPKIQRNIIGKAFIDVMDKITTDLGLDDPILLQGTNAADRIESGISKGDKNTEAIVDHHNQVKEALDKERLEPLDELYKQEIRELAAALGLDLAISDRHPFPGPGLALRVINTGGEVLHRRGLQTEVERYIRQHTIVKQGRIQSIPIECRVLPVRSAGVGGDERSYHSVVAMNQFMSWKDMAKLAHNIPKKFRDDVNRVIIALCDETISKFTVTETKLTEEAFAQLRRADAIVFEEMRHFGLMNKIQQCPVILLPLSFGKPGGRSIVIRPVMTSTFMTVRDMIPGQDLPYDFLSTASERLLSEVDGVTQVFLDQTPKPPGRTEWK